MKLLVDKGADVNAEGDTTATQFFVSNKKL